MSDRPHIVLQRDRHLKWRAFDPLEALLMVLGGVAIAGFSISVACDIVTRTIGAPWLWLQEVTSAFFIYGAFLGLAVATRRADHLMLSAITESYTGATRQALETFNRLVILACGLCMVWFGWENFLHGFGSFRMPSLSARGRRIMPSEGRRRANLIGVVLATGGATGRQTASSVSTSRRRDLGGAGRSDLPRARSSGLADHAAAACSLPTRNSRPSSHMRCKTTASFLASATVARFMPRRWATSMAQRFSAEKRIVRVRIDCAAS